MLYVNHISIKLEKINKQISSYDEVFIPMVCSASVSFKTYLPVCNNSICNRSLLETILLIYMRNLENLMGKHFLFCLVKTEKFTENWFHLVAS